MLRGREGCISTFEGEYHYVLCGFAWEWRCAHLTRADVAGVVRSRKPLAVAIDTMVIGAAFTQCTTGAWGKERDRALTLHCRLRVNKARTHSYRWSCWDAGTRSGGSACVYTASLHSHRCSWSKDPQGSIWTLPHILPPPTHRLRWERRVIYSLTTSARASLCVLLNALLPLQMGQQRRGSIMGLAHRTGGHFSSRQLTFPP